MTTKLSIHNVETLQLGKVEAYNDNPDLPFFTRDVIIKTKDGQEITIVMFADDFDKLFIK